ncbi:hypothetical protein B14911_22637 [Bacillus sp. NRRL B-14911]|nr:hypothetical protein B14911_22637 [Bacillus sp. NRRL B-14911]
MTEEKLDISSFFSILDSTSAYSFNKPFKKMPL